MSGQENRVYVFDNLKALLIFLVVFGHALELAFFRNVSILYIFLYLFHMPLFVFCSGYLASYNPKKILTKLILVYIVFQFLYVLFAQVVLGHSGSLLQFTTPFWIMWYFLALTVWMLHVPLLDAMTNTKRNMVLTICGSIVLGIVSGFDNSLGYFMSLARILYFLPFFVIGFCVKKAVDAQTLQRVTRKWYVVCITGVLSALIFAFLFFRRQVIDVRWLWGAFSYEGLGYTGYSALVRIALYLAAFVISLFVLSIVPRRKMFFSYIGQRTLPIFVFHGFVILLLRRYEVVHAIPAGIVTTFFFIAISTFPFFNAV